MTYKPSANDLLVRQLMQRVEEIDFDLANQLSNAHGQQLVEYEDRAVLCHGRQILATIEGRGFSGEGNQVEYHHDSRWTRILDGDVA
jgi:hypothetical protein